MAYLLVFLPLAASFVVGFFGRALGDRLSQIITCVCVVISALLSIYMFSMLLFIPMFIILKLQIGYLQEV